MQYNAHKPRTFEYVGSFICKAAGFFLILQCNLYAVHTFLHSYVLYCIVQMTIMQVHKLPEQS